MTTRTQVTLDPELQFRARERAAELGVSFAEYVRRLVREDLDEKPRPKADVSAVFALGDSGGSDIAETKDAMVGAAVASRRKP